MKARKARISAAGGAMAVTAATFAAAWRLVEIALGNGAQATKLVVNTLDTASDPEQVAAEEQARRNRELIKPAAVDWLEGTPREELHITSHDGLALHGACFMQEVPTHRWAVLVHGFHGRLEDMATFGHEFFANGFNVLMFDQRAYGQSGGTHTSMGWYERLDLLDWVDWVIQRDQEAQVALMGVSMGATTVLLALGEDVPSQVRCAIADCGFTSLYDEYADKIRKAFHLPAKPLLRAADIIARMRFGFTFREVDARKALARNATPVLYVHGDADDFNPYWMLGELYAADACPAKRRLTVAHARHATSFYTDPELYRARLLSFLGRHITV